MENSCRINRADFGNAPVSRPRQVILTGNDKLAALVFGKAIN